MPWSTSYSQSFLAQHVCFFMNRPPQAGGGSNEASLQIFCVFFVLPDEKNKFSLRHLVFHGADAAKNWVWIFLEEGIS